MAENNSINNTNTSLTIDPGASGDSWLQFSINSTGEFRVGVDDTDSDAFLISQGSALGTNNRFRMSAAGERTMLSQPAFLTYVSPTVTNVTGDGTAYTVILNNEVFDQGADFNTGTGTFTAPVTGKYRLQLSVWFDEVTSSNTSSYIEIVTSNRTYRGGVSNLNIRRTKNGTADQVTSFVAVLADMDVSDTCTTIAMAANSAKVVDIGSVGPTQLRGAFNGTLVC